MEVMLTGSFLECRILVAVLPGSHFACNLFAMQILEDSPGNNPLVSHSHLKIGKKCLDNLGFRNIEDVL